MQLSLAKLCQLASGDQEDPLLQQIEEEIMLVNAQVSVQLSIYCYIPDYNIFSIMDDSQKNLLFLDGCLTFLVK